MPALSFGQIITEHRTALARILDTTVPEDITRPGFLGLVLKAQALASSLSHLDSVMESYAEDLDQAADCLTEAAAEPDERRRAVLLEKADRYLVAVDPGDFPY